MSDLDSARPSVGEHADHPVARFEDPSIVLAHGADAPDPHDVSETQGLREELRRLMAARVSRRSLLTRGATGVGVGALAASLGGLAASPTAAAAAGFDATGDLESLNAAIDVDFLGRVTKKVASFSDTPMGSRPGGSPANLEAVDWIARRDERGGNAPRREAPGPDRPLGLRRRHRSPSTAVDRRSTPAPGAACPARPPAGSHAEVLDLGTGSGQRLRGRRRHRQDRARQLGSSATTGSTGTGTRPRSKAPWP